MKRIVTVAALVAAQLALVAVAVAPQLSARVSGQTYILRVSPVDPIDPFRGAYVALDYPDLRTPGAPGPEEGGSGQGLDDGKSGEVFVVLREDGGVWVADDVTRERPPSGTYLRCDDSRWDLRCGIESLFASQDRAIELEETLAGGAYAEVRIDSRGNAALVDVRERP